jgi:hypothetical protein
LRYFDLPGPNDETTEKIKSKRRERRKTKKDAGKKNKKDTSAEDDGREDEMSPEDVLKTEENKRKEPYTVLIVSFAVARVCSRALFDLFHAYRMESTVFPNPCSDTRFSLKPT